MTTPTAVGSAEPSRPWRKRIMPVVAHVLLIAASILMLYTL